MFFWSAIVPVEFLIYAAGWYLVAVFANQGRDILVRQKVAITTLFVPILIFSHTSYNLLGFDLTNCDREAIEGPLVQYLYVIELLIVGWIAILSLRARKTITRDTERKQFTLLSLGVIIFLLSFTAGNFLVSFFLDVDWSYEQYKLFGMPLLVSFITYSAIKFRTFNLKIILAQALVITLGILVFSLIFIPTLETVRVVTWLTFVLVVVMGYILIQNVRREIEQRQKIEEQEKRLEVVNKEQESLLHFISHEVKGFLSEGQNAFAAIVEGDFGEAPPKVKELSQRALQKMRSGVSTVMDILDAANLKRGSMTYTMTTFDLRQVVERTLELARDRATAKRIQLSLEAPEGEMIFIGDAAKIERHVVRNLIDNAIRYTPSGSIIARLSRKNGFLRLEVEDTGVGITEEDMAHLFTEGGHGKDSIKINVDSTGFGLFVAKKVVDAHGGKIWAESAGKGKGSRFVVEVPLSSSS